MADFGRPVRVTSIGFSCRALREIAEVVDREGARGVDLIVLPETWTDQKLSRPETLEGPLIASMSDLARKHQSYIICPLDRRDGDRRINSAVLLGRSGDVAGIYDKAYPYWSEFDLVPSVGVGEMPEVFETDFGRVGMSICFDVNFPEVWRALADGGAELVVWPSAYAAGTSLQAYALLHHYYIVSATQAADCVVYDITGQQLLHERADNINVSRITLDLDRAIYHENFNLQKRDALLAEHTADVEVDVRLPREEWFVLRAKRPGVSARQLAREYGLEELRDYVDRSRRQIDEMRQSRERQPR